MYEDVDGVNVVLAEEDEPAVVPEGRCHGGMVITVAASSQENVKHLVYAPSLMSDRDETLASLGGSRDPGPWINPRPENGAVDSRTSSRPRPCETATRS